MEFITEQVNGILLHHLKHKNQQLMTVCSTYGAKLIQLYFEANGQLVSVMWETALQEMKSGAWSKSEILFPFPNRLKDGRFTYEGNTYQFPIDEPINMNAIHGIVKNNAFELSGTRVKGDIASISLSHAYDGSLRHYPFPFTLTVTYNYNLSASSLLVDFKVENNGDSKMPFGLGWHPYFCFNNRLIHKIKMNLPDLDLIELNDRQLPTGNSNPYQVDVINFAKVNMDNAFKVVDLNAIYSIEDGENRLIMEPGVGFDYLQLFNPKSDEGLAIEPMTCNVDVLNNHEGLIELNAKDEWMTTFKIIYEKVI